jgi:uncharacterized protein YebE (UPF0316 family)
MVQILELLPYFLAGLAIFALRIVDISLYTTRLMMVFQGRKLLAWVFGFLQALLFITVISSVIGSSEWNLIIGYAAGFATGLIVGMTIESRLALGYTRLRIISPNLGAKIAQTLRERGYGLTEIPAQGKGGTVTLINCYVPRRKTDRVVDIVVQCDAQAFVTVESVRSVQRGFWPR